MSPSIVTCFRNVRFSYIKHVYVAKQNKIIQPPPKVWQPPHTHTHPCPGDPLCTFSHFSLLFVASSLGTVFAEKVRPIHRNVHSDIFVQKMWVCLFGLGHVGFGVSLLGKTNLLAFARPHLLKFLLTCGLCSQCCSRFRGLPA